MNDADGSLGGIIAEREYEFRRANVEQTITLQVGTPEPDPQPGGDWRCSFFLKGLNDSAPTYAYGVDSLQALTLCIRRAEAELTWLGKQNNTELRWLGESALGL